MLHETAHLRAWYGHKHQRIIWQRCLQAQAVKHHLYDDSIIPVFCHIIPALYELHIYNETRKQLT